MKTISISIVIALALIGGAIFSTRSQVDAPVPDGQNVSIVDGKQTIVINVKGGYLPQRSVAKAGIPTVIRFDTNGTFDCSSSVRIPGMNITKMLPQTGKTDIDIGSQQVSILQGTCGMGMYSFEVDFTT